MFKINMFRKEIMFIRRQINVLNKSCSGKKKNTVQKGREDYCTLLLDWVIVCFISSSRIRGHTGTGGRGSFSETNMAITLALLETMASVTKSRDMRLNWREDWNLHFALIRQILWAFAANLCHNLAMPCSSIMQKQISWKQFLEEASKV